VERIESRLEEGFLDATALMEYLIRQGVPMRTAHETVGRLVAECERRGCRLSELTLDEFRQNSPAMNEDVYAVLGVRNTVAALSSYGSGGREMVEEQLRRWEERLEARGG
jgi:argininosuccinate lyase